MPEGATPKDGPSAGIAMATAIVSVLTGIPVRRDIAMTGEVTLRGRVLPIGGLKEKLLAALRGGIKKVLIPEENAKDLVDIPASVKNGMEIVPVSRMDQVLEHALVRQPEPIEWDEPWPADKPAPARSPRRTGRASSLTERRSRCNDKAPGSPGAFFLPGHSRGAWEHGQPCLRRRLLFLSGGQGRLAQLVEHLVYTERVGGSSPSPPTRFPPTGSRRGFCALDTHRSRS